MNLYFNGYTILETTKGFEVIKDDIVLATFDTLEEAKEWCK